MKLITRDTDYAVRAIEYIADKGRVTSVSELVKELKMPRPFLRKLLQRLNKEGILKSYKGTGGGFQMAVPAREVALLDLIRIFQGALTLNECLFRKKPCPRAGCCGLSKEIAGIERQVLDRLGLITVSSLLKKKVKEH